MSSEFSLNSCTVNRRAAAAGGGAILAGMSPWMVSIHSCCSWLALHSMACCSISSCLCAASSSALLSSRSALHSSASMKVLNPRLGVLKPGLVGVEKIRDQTSLLGLRRLRLRRSDL